MRKIVFVGGIHCVGKGYLCNCVKRQLDVEHLSASELIRNFSHQSTDEHKRVKAINKNQDILIQAMESYTSKDIPILLDGHFCLLDNNYEISRVPLQTFQQLNLSGIVTLLDDVSNIAKRLKDRDNLSLDINLIDRFQKAEALYSREVATSLHIDPFLTKGSENIDSVISYMNKIFRDE